MKKYIVMVSSAMLLAACAVPPPQEESTQWKEYFSSENAIAFVDMNTKIWDVAGEGLKTSSILINYPNVDAQGTHSAIMPFALDCKNEMVKIESFTTYDQLDGQGNIITRNEAPEEGFLPLDSFLSGDKIHALICN